MKDLYETIVNVPEYRNIIIYLLLQAFLMPSFGAYGYYFMLDVVKVSKFTFSALRVYEFVGLFIGVQFYRLFFTKYEVRTLLLIFTGIMIILAPINYIFARRLNVKWGIPDMAIILFTDGISEVIFMAMILLPMAAMFTKICPRNIEATSYALLASVANIRGAISAAIGTLINDAFLHVTKKDLSGYWKMCLIGSFCSLIPVIFIFLVPTQKQISARQAEILDRNSVSPEAAGEEASGNNAEQDSIVAGNQEAHRRNREDGQQDISAHV